MYVFGGIQLRYALVMTLMLRRIRNCRRYYYYYYYYYYSVKKLVQEINLRKKESMMPLRKLRKFLLQVLFWYKILERP